MRAPQLISEETRFTDVLDRLVESVMLLSRPRPASPTSPISLSNSTSSIRTKMSGQSASKSRTSKCRPLPTSASARRLASFRITTTSSAYVRRTCTRRTVAAIPRPPPLRRRQAWSERRKEADGDGSCSNLCSLAWLSVERTLDSQSTAQGRETDSRRTIGEVNLRVRRRSVV